MNENIISDHQFDKFCVDLVQLQDEYPEETKQSVYYKEFVGFDGSTGFDLPYNTPLIHGIALKLLTYKNGGNANGQKGAS
jgi:NAD-dependent DNA ligase